VLANKTKSSNEGNASFIDGHYRFGYTISSEAFLTVLQLTLLQFVTRELLNNYKEPVQ
jgi:hypothetical protein